MLRRRLKLTKAKENRHSYHWTLNTTIHILGECSAFLASGSDPINSCLREQIVVTSMSVSGSHLLEACVSLLGWSCSTPRSLSRPTLRQTPLPRLEARHCLRRARSFDMSGLHGFWSATMSVSDILCLSLRLAKRCHCVISLMMKPCKWCFYIINIWLTSVHKFTYLPLILNASTSTAA